VIKALDRDATEVEVSSHTTRGSGRLKHVYFVAVSKGLECSSKAHRPRAKYDDLPQIAPLLFSANYGQTSSAHGLIIPEEPLPSPYSI
jgi:hypothetical protein